MKLNFDSWHQMSGGYRRFYLWQIPLARPIFNYWYRCGGFYLSGWTPVIYTKK